MSDKTKVFARKTNGKLEILNTKLFNDYLASLPDGTEVELKIRKVNNRRHEEQNNYYWLILRIIADELGYDNPDLLHEHFKKEYNSGQSTTDMNPKEFSEYIQKIIIYASGELGIILPSE